MTLAQETSDLRAERNQRTAGNVAGALSCLAPSGLLAQIREAEAEANGSDLYVEGVSVAAEIEGCFQDIEVALSDLNLIRAALESGDYEVGS